MAHSEEAMEVEGGGGAAEKRAEEGGRKQNYSVGQQILAVNKGQLYVAKINKTRVSRGEHEYLVHYAGWKSRYDEWMREERMHVDNEEGRRMQKKLQRNSEVTEMAQVPVAGEDSDDEDQRRGINLNVPSTLQRHLLDEAEWILAGRLPALPREPSAQSVMYKFVSSRGGIDKAEETILNEMRQGIESYMDKSLGMLLLYPQERETHRELMATRKNDTPSSLYGAEHLLRLIVKLPSMLLQADMPRKSMLALQPRLMELLRFLDDHKPELFLSEYDAPKEEAKE